MGASAVGKGVKSAMSEICKQTKNCHGTVPRVGVGREERTKIGSRGFLNRRH